MDMTNSNAMPLFTSRLNGAKKTPEQLVGLGFRYWMAGYQKNDIGFWKTSWDFYTKQLGALGAKSVVTELAYWVQTVNSSTARDIEIAPDCSQFCRDECMAISLIAACQQKHACPALQACAQALIGDCELDCVIEASEGFAYELANHDLVLSGVANANDVSVQTAFAS